MMGTGVGSHDVGGHRARWRVRVVGDKIKLMMAPTRPGPHCRAGKQCRDDDDGIECRDRNYFEWKRGFMHILRDISMINI